MKNIILYKPKLEDLWFRKECLTDEATMFYNAGYDVSYAGYHYDTGCIDFEVEKWEEWYNTKMLNPNFYFAYIKDLDTNKFVGYVNFNMNETTKKATCGIVIKNDYRNQGYMRPSFKELINEAKSSGVKVLSDIVPQNRENALKVFYDLGFKKVGESVTKKFGKDEIVFEIELEL